MLVVRRLLMAGWRTMAVQAAAAGKPPPIPDPMAPRPMQRPADKSAQAVNREALANPTKSKISATTSAKIEADSAMACPTSMFLNTSPDIAGLREMARLASAAVCPSPMAAPMAPNPMAMPPPA